MVDGPEHTADNRLDDGEQSIEGVVGDAVVGRDEGADAQHPSKPLIEIGWLIAGRPDAPDLEATRQARQTTTEFLRDVFPQFTWKMPLLERDEATSAQRIESVELLDYAVTERNLRHWDFTVVITPADLVSQYKSDALSVVSRALQAMVISTARIDPRAYDPTIPREVRVQTMARRIHALVVHMLGHLVGLEHADDPASWMARFETISDLDAARNLDPSQMRAFEKGLREVADRRLEEQPDVQRMGMPRFYLHATWINRRQIAAAVWQARPWQFPFRLSRLTTAAFSAMLILLITAEAWELGLSQPVPRLAVFAMVAIALTTIYIISRQRLFVRREHARLSELSVMTNVSTCAIVLWGMTTTFLALAIITFVLAQLLFSPDLVAHWAPAATQTRGVLAHARLAAFVASVGISIGALGASFEQQHYFRHITYVDEEI